MDIDQSGAPPPGEIFDEAWYLSEYPGVAQVVRDGGFRSAWEHYVIHGRAEGRHPVPLTRIAQSIAAGSMGQPGVSAGPPFWNHNGAGFSAPEELRVSNTELNRVALIGPPSLMAEWIDERAVPGCSIDMVAVESNARPPGRTAAEIASYAFVVVQVSIREVIEDGGFGRLPYSDLPAHARLLHSACQLLDSYLTSRMRWNLEHGALTFVTNFFVPQHNPMGRLFPRYDLRNPEYFVNELNRHLETIVRRHHNAFVLDLDRLAASMGRRFVQDDLLFPMEHGAVLPRQCSDPGWIGPLASLSEHYDIRTKSLFPDIAWAELMTMYRTARKADCVRLVVVELVDTLWKSRGGPGTDIDGPPTDGWPAGVTEALIYLRKRGIQLAINSHNDEQFVREIWPDIVGDGLRIDDFAALRINWRPKPENMGELLRELNMPSRSVLFIDADPAEREAMRVAFPDIRTLGGLPYYLRRMLLLSSETQVIGEYSDWANRIEVIRAPSTHDVQGAAVREPAVAKAPADSTQSGVVASRQRLELLWFRAMNNDITPDDARELRRLSMAIAVTDHSIRRVNPFPKWYE